MSRIVFVTARGQLRADFVTFAPRSRWIPYVVITVNTKELISMTHSGWRFGAVIALTLAAVLGPPAALASPQVQSSAQPKTGATREFTHDAGFSVKGQGRPISPEEAKRLSPMMPGDGDGTVCWSTTTTRSRGLWPYGRAVHLYTIWCAKGGVINYRDSAAWTSVDFLCSSSNLWWGKVGGGAGWTFVDVQAQAEFACQSPWWFDWHDFLMQRIRYHSNGWYEPIAYQ